MHPNEQAYNQWAEQYDTNKNKTRDLEAIALRKKLGALQFSSVLEIGCGTGKNSSWLVTQAENVVSADFSEEMLNKAKEKIDAKNIEFVQADITKLWDFTNKKFDLIGFSLVLEHIEDLDFIFAQVAQKINAGGHVYVGELHPFKQYQGSLARFETENGTVKLDCFTHNISDFAKAAKKHGLELVDVDEWFDEGETGGVPRILSLIFKAA